MSKKIAFSYKVAASNIEEIKTVWGAALAIVNNVPAPVDPIALTNAAKVCADILLEVSSGLLNSGASNSTDVWNAVCRAHEFLTGVRDADANDPAFEEFARASFLCVSESLCGIFEDGENARDEDEDGNAVFTQEGEWYVAETDDGEFFGFKPCTADDPVCEDLPVEAIAPNSLSYLPVYESFSF